MGICHLIDRLAIKVDKINVVVLARSFICMMGALRVDRGVQKFPGKPAGLLAIVGLERRLVGEKRLVDILVGIITGKRADYEPILDDPQFEAISFSWFA